MIEFINIYNYIHNIGNCIIYFNFTSVFSDTGTFSSFQPKWTIIKAEFVATADIHCTIYPKGTISGLPFGNILIILDNYSFGFGILLFIFFFMILSSTFYIVFPCILISGMSLVVFAGNLKKTRILLKFRNVVTS